MSTHWDPEHCDVLREYLEKGATYLEAAVAINEQFGMAYTRAAAMGRAKRMGLTSEHDRQANVSTIRIARAKQRCGDSTEAEVPPIPVLRCVEIEPRHLALADLERDDCRYPYGGAEFGEPITFCGHPTRGGGPYCWPHHRLAHGPGTFSERAASSVSLSIVGVAAA